ARQDLADLSRRTRSVPRSAQSAGGDALPLAGGRARQLSRRARNLGAHVRRRDHGPSSPTATGLRGAIPSRVDLDHRRETVAAELLGGDMRQLGGALVLCVFLGTAKAQDAAGAAEQVMAQGQQLFEKGDYAS